MDYVALKAEIDGDPLTRGYVVNEFNVYAARQTP